MILANKYKMLEKICPHVVKGENIRTKELVAIKIEEIQGDYDMVKRETLIYQYLKGCKNIPQVKWFGVINEYRYMVLPLLKETLMDYHPGCKQAFLLMQKMIKILQMIHEKKLIHRDIKPDNFMFDFSNEPVLYLIDFGFCKKYIEDSGAHICEKSGKEIMGTINYISINIHNGIEASRRDDLESLAYILLQVLDGDLPWNTQHLNAKKEMKLSKFNYPVINTYLNYCRNLKFSETPDYVYLLQLF